MESIKKVIFPPDIKLKFKTYVTTRSGLYFKDHDLRDLEDAISQRMYLARIESPIAYYDYFTKSDKKEDEFRELVNLLTIKHTYFFRNEEQFNVLKNRVLPEIITRKDSMAKAGDDKARRIRIWSAGCSTGEEAYSIAMTIVDVMGNTSGWDIQIMATDASTEALEKARRGLYTPSSLKPVDSGHLDRYFVKDESKHGQGQYRVIEELKKMITFAYHNLITDEFPSDFDIIFCRNVVIYFELNTVISVMEKFYSALNAKGYIFIGYSESLYFMPGRFKMISRDEAIYYVKAPHHVAEEVEVVKSPVASKTLDEVLEELSRAEIVAAMESEVRKAKEQPKNIEDILVEANKSFYMKDYSKALSLIRKAHEMNKDAVDPYYLASEIFVNQGRFAEAKENLATALKLNPLFAPAHYLLGCILIEENLSDEAKSRMKKALFIDRDFSLAHFYLAHLYKTEGKADDALREYRNTLKVLSKNKSEDVIAYGGGFNVAILTSACRDNIERLKMES